MINRLTNLLPSARRDALVREYYLRVGVVAVSLGILLLAVAAVFLVPTYVFLAGSAQAKETRLAGIQSTLSSADEVALSARLAALSSDAAVLTSLAGKQSASSAIRFVLAVPRPGVTLSGFTYTPASGKTPGVLALSGSAVTRDALRSYQLALQGSPLVSSADLPVSAYAKDADISFTITILLTP